MAVINRKYGYLFLAEPHCATRSVEAALQRQRGSQVIQTAWTHATYQELLDQCVVTINEPLFKFSVIRHPCDWAVTRYHQMTGWHKEGFAAFIKYHLDNGLWANSIFVHARYSDYTIRFESLQSALNAVLESRGSPPVCLGRLGETADRKSWPSYFTRTLLQSFADGIPDFRTYGYKARP